FIIFRTPSSVGSSWRWCAIAHRDKTDPWWVWWSRFLGGDREGEPVPAREQLPATSLGVLLQQVHGLTAGGAVLSFAHRSAGGRQEGLHRCSRRDGQLQSDLLFVTLPLALETPTCRFATGSE